jgi:hypothetical protein
VGFFRSSEFLLLVTWKPQITSVSPIRTSCACSQALDRTDLSGGAGLALARQVAGSRRCWHAQEGVEKLWNAFLMQKIENSAVSPERRLINSRAWASSWRVGRLFQLLYKVLALFGHTLELRGETFSRSC